MTPTEIAAIEARVAVLRTQAGDAGLPLGKIWDLVFECLEEAEGLLADRRELVAEVERLKEQVYAPGEWRCAKCSLRLTAKVIASSGLGMDEKPQQCPNDCGPMWRVTEREYADQVGRAAEQLLERATAAEAALADAVARERERCAGIADARTSQLQEMIAEAKKRRHQNLAGTYLTRQWEAEHIAAAIREPKP